MTISKKGSLTDSDTIIAWLKAHPLINRHALCALTGYNSANLQHAMDGKRAIPAKHIPAIAAALKPYGF
jgi:hypothetical protein